MKTLAQCGIHHIGFVVENFEEAIDHLKSFYDIQKLQIYNFKPNKAWIRGEEIPECRLNIAMCSFGHENKDTFEIINPLVGQSLFKEFIEQGNRGFHHICFPVDNFDESKEYYLKNGAEIIFEHETEDDIIGYRRGMFMYDKKLDLIFEIKENPYFRNK